MAPQNFWNIDKASIFYMKPYQWFLIQGWWSLNEIHTQWELDFISLALKLGLCLIIEVGAHLTFPCWFLKMGWVSLALPSTKNRVMLVSIWMISFWKFRDLNVLNFALNPLRSWFCNNYVIFAGSFELLDETMIEII